MLSFGQFDLGRKRVFWIVKETVGYLGIELRKNWELLSQIHPASEINYAQSTIGWIDSEGGSKFTSQG